MGSQSTVEYLRLPTTIRHHCKQVFDWVSSGQSEHFSLNMDQLEGLADKVIEVTKDNYPELEIPYHSRWGHFEQQPLKDWLDSQSSQTLLEQGRKQYELVILSVLLDAGAGTKWKYKTPSSEVFNRSEGLAIASFYMYQDGYFTSQGEEGVQAKLLKSITAEKLAQGMQVSENNPLLGLEGRANLLNRLGACIEQNPHFFAGTTRLGCLFDSLAQEPTTTAPNILHKVLNAFGDLWPSRLSFEGINLGDVWQHPAVNQAQDSLANGYVPFHKLSQWLSYSLIEPLEWAGIKVVDIDSLTGLAEYRNGGLFLDGGVIQLKKEGKPTAEVSSSLIVEWRALTVVLLDKIAQIVRKQLNMNEEQLPLAKVLQGGTWATGRILAKQLREDASPPIDIVSDGTVF